MQKIKSTTIKFTNGDNKVNIFVSAFTTDDNKNLRGFANVSILDKDNKMVKQNNGYQIIEGKTDNLFLVEPRQKSYKDKDGNWQDGSLYFLEKREVKEDLIKHIIAKALVAE